MPWESPDLLVVDGGRGQLNVALAAARDLELHDLPIVGLAKERETVTGETETDRVYLPGQKNGITIRPHTALVWLARLRDEAHRFANSCLLYTSDAADDLLCVDLGGRRIIKKKKNLDYESYNLNRYRINITNYTL